MPYIIRPRQIHRIAAGLFSALLLLCAAPALAHASCGVTHGSKVFSSYGDQASYALVEGGLFESGAPGWSLQNAGVIDESAEQENGNNDGGDEGGEGQEGPSHALVIRPRGYAVSPAFCVDSQYPSLRFLIRRVEGPAGATLDVSLRWTDRRGTHETNDASLRASRHWELTPVLELASKLPAGVTPNVRLVFQPNDGVWAIGDVYVDPYSR